MERTPYPVRTQEEVVLATCVLVLCPHADGRDSLAQALQDRYVVLTAATTEEALRLVRTHAPCRLVYCEMDGAVETTLEAAQALKRLCPAMAVIALARPPYPGPLRQATQKGLLYAVQPLPLVAESLLQQTEATLAHTPPVVREPKHACGLLTREEIDFLLGRASLGELVTCPPVS